MYIVPAWYSSGAPRASPCAPPARRTPRRPGRSVPSLHRPAADEACAEHCRRMPGCDGFSGPGCTLMAALGAGPATRAPGATADGNISVAVGAPLPPLCAGLSRIACAACLGVKDPAGCAACVRGMPPLQNDGGGPAAALNTTRVLFVDSLWDWTIARGVATPRFDGAEAGCASCWNGTARDPRACADRCVRPGSKSSPCWACAMSGEGTWDVDACIACTGAAGPQWQRECR
jgi:hypothetical protein